MHSSVPLIVTLLLAATTWGQDYFSTNDRMCLDDDYFGPICGDGAVAGPVTEEQKKEILHVHNLLRSKVASGQELRGNPGPQPPAKNMKKLTWSEELATLAQRWANMCNTKVHGCLRFENKTKSGQNLHAKFSNRPETSVNYTQAVLSWYSEVEQLDPVHIDRFPEDRAIRMKIGHYTQVVWAKTSSVGCGHTKFIQKKGQYTLVVVCNYFPSGNGLNVKTYIKGESSCTCDKEYPALCCESHV